MFPTFLSILEVAIIHLSFKGSTKLDGSDSVYAQAEGEQGQPKPKVRSQALSWDHKDVEILWIVWEIPCTLWLDTVAMENHYFFCRYIVVNHLQMGRFPYLS